MAHFGIISPPVAGHINPMSALGRELVARGHRATFIQLIDLEQKVRSEGLEFLAFGCREFPRDSLATWLRTLGQLKGLSAVRFTVRAVARTSAALCRDAPSLIRSHGIGALIVDQMEPAGAAVAEHLDLPFVTVCNALAINQEARVPPPFTGWRFHDSRWARTRNRLGYSVGNFVLRPIVDTVREYRRTWRLPAVSYPNGSFSPRAQICQMPRAFDFPRQDLPETFHYVGPLRRAGAVEPAFPWERLDGRRIIYASLGTLQNSREPLFRAIAEACKPLDVQLIISHGGGLADAQASALPGSPLVVRFAPQSTLLKRAALTITHAGLNTVLDSVAAGVPLVAIPITYEQPAIARRIERAGVGATVRLSQAAPERLRQAVLFVLHDRLASARAKQIARETADAGGVTRAATIIEGAVSS